MERPRGTFLLGSECCLLLLLGNCQTSLSERVPGPAAVQKVWRVQQVAFHVIWPTRQALFLLDPRIYMQPQSLSENVALCSLLSGNPLALKAVGRLTGLLPCQVLNQSVPLKHFLSPE